MDICRVATMKEKSIWRIAVSVPLEAEDAIVDLFTRMFFRSAPSTYISHKTNLATVAVYYEEKPNLSSVERDELVVGLKRIRECGLNVGSPRLSIKKLPQQDWAESWKKHFQPIEIGSTLLIKPSWNKQRPKKGQATLVLDPGLSFGTGQHPTTEYCLRELVRRRNVGTEQAFLDIGTGSGILAIAAARLGYKPVDAFDFDPEAVRVASANAKRNRVSSNIRFFEQDVTRLPKAGAKYSVICANLISNLLIDVRRRILARLDEGGVVVVAGILRKEFEEVQRTYEKAGMELIKCGVQKEWRSGTLACRDA